MLFTDLPLCESLLDGLQAMNFKEATPVQELAIPVILQKKDVIACAQTGTGKTAAFLLPLLNNLQSEPHDEHKVNAIIMAPTRELAQQIDQQMEGFSYFTPFSSVAVYGGNDGDAWDVQKRGLASGADVVVATPGRLLSHINLYDIDFSGVKYFILDEADRMLDMGFFDDIMKIEKLLPKDRQTIMFSATMPPKIQQLARTILRNPEEISIAITRPPETIIQSVYLCYEPQKMMILKELFKEKKPKKVILFSGSKMRVKEIAKTLRSMGLSAGEMHSDLDQAQRDSVMHEFRNERVDILVATDIVARGIDIDDITLVINFEVPYDVEDYVHRIGRTARAGDTGMAITFVAPDEQYRLKQIEEFLEKTIYRVPLPEGMGEAPEYNPVREVRGRGKGRSDRSSRQGRRKQTRKSRDSRSVAKEKGESGEQTERTSRPKRNYKNKRNSGNRKNSAQGGEALQSESTPNNTATSQDVGENRNNAEAVVSNEAKANKNERANKNKRRKKRRPQREATAGAGRDTASQKTVKREGNAPREEGATERRKPKLVKRGDRKQQEGAQQDKPRGSRPSRKLDSPAAQQKNNRKPQQRTDIKEREKGTKQVEEQKGKRRGILSWLFGKKK